MEALRARDCHSLAEANGSQSHIKDSFQEKRVGTEVGCHCESAAVRLGFIGTSASDSELKQSRSPHRGAFLLTDLNSADLKSHRNRVRLMVATSYSGFALTAEPFVSDP